MDDILSHPVKPGEEYVAGAQLWKEEALRHVASRASTALGALALCALLRGAFGVAQLRRYPVAS